MNYSDEEKIKRLLDAQEHPECYTDSELREILHDVELLVQLKRALSEERAESEDFDVDRAWETFSHSHPEDSSSDGHGARRRHPRRLRVAAMFIGCVLLTGMTFAAMTRLGWIRSLFAAHKPEVEQTIPVSASPHTSSVAIESSVPKSAPVVQVFENVTLADILSTMAQYYRLKVVYHSEVVKSIRLHFEWDRAKSIDANIAILNGFQQITITRSGDTLNVK